MPDPVDRRDRLALVNTVLAARRYFLDGATKSEIANELGLSRFKVARLLDDALRDGIVRIEIDAVPEVDEVLSRELAVALGIRSAVVVRTVEDPANSSDPSSVAPRRASLPTPWTTTMSWASRGAGRSTR